MRELVGVQDFSEVNFNFKRENVGSKLDLNLETKKY